MNDVTNQSGIPYMEMGVPFILGLAVGYTMKKIFKIALFFLGITVIALFVLENQHILTINGDELQDSIGTGKNGFMWLFNLIKTKITLIEGGSALSGFVLGLKMG